MPAGLIKGDWIEIPLASPFAADPAKNLVVQMASDPGASGYSCNPGSSSADYHALTNNRAFLVGNVNAFQAGLSLGYTNRETYIRPGIGHKLLLLSKLLEIISDHLV